MIEKFGLVIKSGKLFFLGSGAGRPKEATNDNLISHLVQNYKISYKEVEKVRDEILSEFNNIADSQVEPHEKRQEIISALNPFKDFFVYQNDKSGSLIVYHKKQDQITPICPLSQMDNKMFKHVLVQHDPVFYENLISTLQKIINPKNPDRTSSVEVLDICMNVLKPEINMERKLIQSEPHPAVVEGIDVPALRIIPYKKQEVTIDSLNPYLKEFLTRVDNHENMCAQLWTNLIGIKTPCLIYLKGMGNDGKSLFVKMLGLLVGSVCNYDWSERFNYFNMFGKSLIVMNENKMPNILQHSVLKAITGGDFVQIEAKGKNAFSAEVRGQLIIVANDDLKTLGTPDEARRLRYYAVKPHNLTQENVLLPDEYLNEISSTSNEFLNYLRVCYEKNKTNRNSVVLPVNHMDYIRGLRDPVVSSTFKRIIDRLKSCGFEFNAELSCDTHEIISIVNDLDKKNNYAVPNFEALLSVDFGVSKVMNKYIGLGKIQLTKGEKL